VSAHTATVACVTGAGARRAAVAEAVAELGAAAVHVAPTDRAAIVAADAVLLAGADVQTVARVTRELDLRARATRVRRGARVDVLVLAPCGRGRELWAIERAFELAERRASRLGVIGDNDWRHAVRASSVRHREVALDYVLPAHALPLAAFEPERFDVLAVSRRWAGAVAEVAASRVDGRVVAHAFLAAHGPSVFIPAGRDGRSLRLAMQLLADLAGGRIHRTAR
jgi:hypothetical protein